MVRLVALEFSVSAGFATDYIYRGTTVSARQPAVGAAFEAAFDMFYAGSTIASVKLPSQPAAEITMAGGIRPKLWDINFDFRWTYFSYPGETPPPGVFAGIEYWEAGARADTKIGELLRVAGGFAYSPNVSNTGAWSKYAAFGMGIDVPGKALPQDITASVTGGAGYFWFGNQSVSLGGFPLPAYLNWNAGVTFTRKNFNLDLRYYRHQSLQGKLLRLHWRSNRHTGRKRRPGEKSGRSHLPLVQRHVCREVLVRIELAGWTSPAGALIYLMWIKALLVQPVSNLTGIRRGQRNGTISPADENPPGYRVLLWSLCAAGRAELLGQRRK